MEKIHLPASDLKPLVLFTEKDQTLKIEGKMIPENIEEVMGPIYAFLETYFRRQDKLHVLFRLYYYNTSSARQLYMLCRELERLHEEGKKITARWDYEEGDEESHSDAQEFLGGMHFPYEIVEVTE